MNLEEGVLLSDGFESIVHEAGHGSRTRRELSDAAGEGSDAIIDSLVRGGILHEDGGLIRPTAIVRNLDRICTENPDPDDRADSLESYLSWSGVDEDSVSPPFDPDVLSILSMFALTGAEEMTMDRLEMRCDRLGLSIDGIPDGSDAIIESDGGIVRLTPRGKQLARSMHSVLTAMFDDRAPIPGERSPYRTE